MQLLEQNVQLQCLVHAREFQSDDDPLKDVDVCSIELSCRD